MNSRSGAATLWSARSLAINSPILAYGSADVCLTGATLALSGSAASRWPFQLAGLSPCQGCPSQHAFNAASDSRCCLGFS
jgi:hypothetical protein